jgi:hypothetical protein
LVFTCFRGNGEDGLHLAASTNGYDRHGTAVCDPEKVAPGLRALR